MIIPNYRHQSHILDNTLSVMIPNYRHQNNILANVLSMMIPNHRNQNHIFNGIMLLGDLFPTRSQARDVWVF